MKAKLKRLVGVSALLLLALYLAMLLLPEQLGAFIDIHRFTPIILIALVILNCIHTILSPRPSERERSLPEPSAATSGAIVVLATGCAAAAWLGYRGYEADGWPGLTLPLVIAVLTGTIAMAVARFATLHEGEIGEARFDTSNPA